MSVYVTAPPHGADDASARTLTLYHEGRVEGCDEDGSEKCIPCYVALMAASKRGTWVQKALAEAAPAHLADEL